MLQKFSSLKRIFQKLRKVWPRDPNVYLRFQRHTLSMEYIAVPKNVQHVLDFDGVTGAIGHVNTHSSKRRVKARVPQGSTLSPLLYSTYTNDIPRPLSGIQLALFAYDTALYLRGHTESSIYPPIQRAIDELAR
ncbi:hypothetical protein EVAR_41779_1 [Eumeta japonica]|uniref:Reverse transcriptase domain-containing protein n=1 Tax=Eumeta variegata TaxID=151549 RepID=A0A4C1W045_EUMVA|nr:hypothetical protein EVAR_41779_1 [Eumeta japonica]